MTFHRMTKPSHNELPARPEVQVRGPLDTIAVNHLLDRIAQAPDASHVVIDCSQVSSVDPVGTARLWVLARELELAGRMLRIIGLPERFTRRLRLHPVLRFVEQEESVFTDPFGAAVSTR
jgi:anti-anti-sigma regulatory factor